MGQVDAAGPVRGWRSGNYTPKPSQGCKVSRELGRAGLGRLQILLSGDDRVWPEELGGASHHLGTTRMHPDPARGVVDADCRVHGLANLYVAGSSVFPTSGAAGPTFTLVALALRLADHVREVLG